MNRIILKESGGDEPWRKFWGVKFQKNIRIGESWEIVDRTDCQSTLVDSQNDSITLRELLKSQPHKIMGPGWDEGERFQYL